APSVPPAFSSVLYYIALRASPPTPADDAEKQQRESKDESACEHRFFRRFFSVARLTFTAAASERRASFRRADTPFPETIQVNQDLLFRIYHFYSFCGFIIFLSFLNRIYHVRCLFLSF